MPRDTYTPPDWDAGEIAERDDRAFQYYERIQTARNRRAVNAYCAALVGVFAATMIARWL